MSRVVAFGRWHRRRAVEEGGFGGREGEFGEREAKLAPVDLPGLMRRSSEGRGSREGEAQLPQVGVAARSESAGGAAGEPRACPVDNTAASRD